MKTEIDDFSRAGAGASSDVLHSDDIAIVGMALTVPGANSVEQFWTNLRNGVESITRIDADTARANGSRPDMLLHENYVPAAALLDGYADFDAEFFGFSPKEAMILDPQHRKFLEVSWEALENAGHPPKSFDGDIGVFGGCGMGSYFYFNICSNPDLVDDVGMFLLRHTGNDKDFLTTRVSHVFDLHGPSVGIQTACSTSLVAVHEARKALLDGTCDMAIAGGVTIELPQGQGYIYKEGEILSPDGHCHAFDHRAQGTVFGSGAGTVVLRRLKDAQADGDTIFAVIKGSAVNNDGADKASYLAPSVEGQSKAISAALADAGVSADTINYVECHGTGTYLGDPIEVAALTQAFAQHGGAEGTCRIGSVKTNIGHLDTAAGVVSLIKATLAVRHGEMPPSLGYDAPNPAIDFDHSPFSVNAALTPFPTGKGPRRAGVNSLGVGGTNAHVVLEEAPARSASEEADWPFQPIVVSGHSPAALDANVIALRDWLTAHPDADLADVAHTLRNGRTGHKFRRVTVADDATQAAELLTEADTRRLFTHENLGPGVDVAFLFPGGGAQYPNMARDLYETEPEFADWMDKGLAYLAGRVDYDPREAWLPEAGQEEVAAKALLRPSVQLPLIMIVEFALAKLMQSWGVRPSVLLGHSMGENAAAALAGVMTFEDCIDLVLLRGRLFDRVEPGGMLSVPMPEAELSACIGDDLDMASVNAPSLCAVSGPKAALEDLKARLMAEGIESQFVQIDIAAHSRMLDGILNEFREFLASLQLKAPRIPIMSNRTGKILTRDEATSPDYWVGQLRNTVMFGDCVAALARKPDRIYLEVGPGKALTTLARMNPEVKPGQVIAALRHGEDTIEDDRHFLAVIARLWACGYEADWDQVWGEARRNRLELPTYAFQRSRYFIEPGAGAQEDAPELPMRLKDMADWGTLPGWRPRYADLDPSTLSDLGSTTPANWLMFMDDLGLAEAVATRLEAAGHKVIRVTSGDAFRDIGDGRYALATEQGRAPYDALMQSLNMVEQRIDHVVHFWLVTEGETFRPGSSMFNRNLEHGFYALTWLGQAMADAGMLDDVSVTVFTNGAERVAHEVLAQPEKALIAGPVGVIPREIPGTRWGAVDLDLPVEPVGRRRKSSVGEDVVDVVLTELLAGPDAARVAHRLGTRYVAQSRPAPLSAKAGIAKGGTWLITGGLGGIGQTLAKALLSDFGANVVLVGRRELPDQADWPRYLAQFGPQDPTSRAIVGLQALEQLGGDLRYHTADICNVADLTCIVEQTLTDLGPITGVIHAAGVIDDGPFLTKNESGLAAVFHPKIDGLRALDAVFPDGSLEHMVLFASSSTATTPAGQIDYVAANAYLNAFAQSRAGGRTKVRAVNWGVWADTGMAAEAMDGVSDEAEAVDLPLLTETRFDAEGRRVLTGQHQASDWVYAEHQTKAGDILLPGTGYIELAAEAAQAHHLAYPFEIRDLYFYRPLGIASGGTKQVSAVLDRSPEGGFALDIRSEARLGAKQGTVLNAEAQLVEVPATAPEPLDLAIIRSRLGAMTQAMPGETLSSPQEANLLFGPRWGVLTSMQTGEGEGLAELALPAQAADDLEQGFRAHPALLDQATGWAMGLVPGYAQSHLWVPVSYNRIRFYAPLPARIESHVRLAESSPSDCAFDITLATPEGAVLAEITGFRMTRLEQMAGFTQSPLAENEIEVPEAAYAAPVSPGERLLRHNVTQGIRAEDGAEALSRALALDVPQVYVSSLDLQALIDQANRPVREAAQPLRTARSDDTPVAAPETPVQIALAEIWEGLLGVTGIGIHDDFFDLGGHSLLAVRLFAGVKRAFSVDFPISVLFEAPTIARLAEMIDARGGSAVETDSDAPEVQTHRFLVPLTPNSSSKTPLFIVGGMFGNVLNLRHLGLILGKERKVYGIQAQGLLDDEEPHATVGEAAEAYLAEVRAVQPHGPYMLSGFSGGGITAFEMAQRLRAAGEEVSVLALLDTPLPVRPSLSRKDKGLIKIAEIREKGAGYLAEWARNRIAWEAEKRARAERREAGDTAGSFHNVKIEAAFRAAVGAYELTPWDGPMTLFRPPLNRHWSVSGGNYVSHEREYVFHDNQWTATAPKLEVIEVPGDHDSMVLVPNVAVLAKSLSDVIAKAEAQRPIEDQKEAAE